jgi:iron-sulfur cluster assembly protein
MPIVITEKAAKEVIKVMADQQMDPKDNFLRVSVAAGGCSGFSYKLDFITESQVEEMDVKQEFHGVTAVVDTKSDLYLDGTVLDFYEDINRRGFKFENPSAKGCCGCGSSFNVA